MRTFVDAQRALGNTEPIFFWFDCCVVDEHAGVQDWSGSFEAAVAKIGHTCLMMTPWSAPIVITRAWCLW